MLEHQAPGKMASRASADLNKYPYYVQVQSPPGIYRCGGALLSKSVALTAAHCVKGLNAASMKIFSVQSNSQRNNLTTQTIDVKEIVLHDNFHPETLQHNIALVFLTAAFRLQHEVDFSTIQSDKIIFRDNATLFSWVQHKSDLANPSFDFEILKTKVYIIPNEDCSKAVNKTVSISHICAEAVGNGTHPSSWGGFLDCDGENGTNFLCGILSWGNGSGFPAVFTNIAAYNKWIRLKLFEQSSQLVVNDIKVGDKISALSGCSADQFRCNVTQKCINASYVCDGDIEDCGRADKSDEEDCRALNGCHRTQFSCKKGNQCVPSHLQCDGRNDCYDLSDEENCPLNITLQNCKSNEFQCNVTKKCILQDYLCDVIPHCGEADSSDEENCREENGCHSSQFPCRLGNKCIPHYKRCDGKEHCIDGSDEDNCNWEERNNCTAWQVPCNSPNKCYTLEKICNGENDCGNEDTSDEVCPTGLNGCHWTQFECFRNRKCIPGWNKCNGRKDCTDGSDEQNCDDASSYHGTQFACHNDSKLILASYRCDGDQDCSDGSDEYNCDEPGRCHWTQFRCHDGSQCLPGHFKCDGEIQCSDSSDEEACLWSESINCTNQELQCNITRKCYGLQDICDTHRDCGEDDPSDETNCTKGTNGSTWTQIHCHDGQCVQGLFKCDGTLDCKDGTDEENCFSSNHCHWTQFSCRNDSKCIRNQRKCDGKNDCADGSDEENCDDLKRCHWSEFPCLDKSACLPGHFKCDGDTQCNDGSDELDCKQNNTSNCNLRQLECANVTGKCYEMTDICNGQRDCASNDTSDESNCEVGTNGCHWNQFACRIEKKCIHSYQICDGEKDCQDGSDEESCDKADDCHWTHFGCSRNDSKCIHRIFICDGVGHCLDGSDEENCNDPKRCHWSQFGCVDKSKCLPGHFKCDGKTQCNDDSDEEDCGDGQPTSMPVATLAGYLAIPSGLVVTLVVVLILLYRKYRQQTGRLSEMEIRLFERGDEKQFQMDKFAHENAQFIPYNRNYEIKWKDFKISDEDKLGEGAYGVVFKGHLSEKPASTVAVKTVKGKVDKSVLLALLSELKVMIHLGKHENIVEVLGACTEFLRDGRAYVLVEYCPMGSLESYLRKLDKELGADDGCLTISNPKDIDEEGTQDETLSRSHKDLVSWAMQISRGMQHLQQKKVIHGDLATRNILLYSKDQVKITDFGLSRQLANYDINYVKKTQAMLPWRWLALETLKSMVFTHKSDVWAYGVTLWEIFSLGRVPYPGTRWTTDFVGFLEEGQRLSKPKHASDDIQTIMMHRWESEPNKRPDFRQIEDMLRMDIARLLAPTPNYVTVVTD